MANMYKEIMDTIEPIVIENISNVLSLVAASQTGFQSNIPSVRKPGIMLSKASNPPHGDEYPVDDKDNSTSSVSADTNLEAKNTSVSKDATAIPCSTLAVTQSVDKVNMDKDQGDEFLLLTMPSIEHLDKLNEGAWNFSSFCSTKCMLEMLKPIPTESGFDLPYNHEFLESLYPQKVPVEPIDDYTCSLLDLVTWDLEKSVDDKGLSKELENKVFFGFENPSFSQELDPKWSFTNVGASSPKMTQWNPNKRSIKIAEHCVALKKRAKMFEISEEPMTTSENAPAVNTSNTYIGNEQGEPTSCSNKEVSQHYVPGNERSDMCNMNEEPSTYCPNSSISPSVPIALPHERCEATSSKNDQVELPSRITSVFHSHEEVLQRSQNRFNNFDPVMDNEEFDRQLYISTLKVEAELSAYRSNSQFVLQTNTNTNFSQGNNINMARSNYQFVAEDSSSNEIRTNPQFFFANNQNVHIAEVNPNNVISSFTSTPVEIDVFDDIISRIPKTKKAKTKNVVKMGTTWVEHRVFALSMMVYGNVNPYVINMLGKAVMVELAEKEKLNLLPIGHWKRFFFDYKISALFMKSCENPGTLSNYIGYNMIGKKLDSRDLVHLPLFTSGFYFLLVVNFKEMAFEVLYPNNKEYLVSDDANIAINNFKLAFKIAYRHSTIKVDNMKTIFRSVCSSEKDSDSGVYVMELIRNQTDGKILCFQPTHAKPLRESLTYYMLAHPFNELMPPETINILRKHKIPYNFKDTPGYYPWIHEQAQTSSDQTDDMMGSLT